MIDRMRAPYCCELDGADGSRVNVFVTPDDAAVVLDTAALKAMNKV